MKDFHKFKVWEKSHQLALEIYQATQDFPRQEMFGLTSQVRRSCTSIPANIAEGCGREGQAEFAHFLAIAAGSASETEYHLLLARDLGYLDTATHQRLQSEIVEVKKMLTSLITKLKADR